MTKKTNNDIYQVMTNSLDSYSSMLREIQQINDDGLEISPPKSICVSIDGVDVTIMITIRECATSQRLSDG